MVGLDRGPQLMVWAGGLPRRDFLTSVPLHTGLVWESACTTHPVARRPMLHVNLDAIKYLYGGIAIYTNKSSWYNIRV